MSEYIMECKTVQTGVFKTLVEALKDILTDINIEFHKGNSESPNDDEKGYIKIVALDSTVNIMVHLKLDGARFESYYCKRRMLVGVSMMYFHKLIKTISNSNDCLTLYIAENDENKLGIKIENSEKNSVTNYKLNLMDIKYDDINIPPQKFDNIISMPSDDFQKICKDMNNLAEIIEIKNVGNKLIFACSGDFADQETVCSEHSGLKFDKMNDSHEVIQGYYNLRQLVLFTKCTHLSNSVEMFIKNDFPLIIQYKVGSLGCLKLILAPKVK